MDQYKQSTARQRNRDAVRRHRQNERMAEAEMHALYDHNEKQIRRLENMADRLANELSRTGKN